MGTNSETKRNSAEWEAEAQTPGEALRRGRINKGLELDDAAVQLGLTPSRVEAIETNNYEHLPAPVYVRGYIKRYCAILGIDADPVINGYEQLADSPIQKELASSADNAGGNSVIKDIDTGVRRPFKDRQGLFLVVVIVVVLLLMWIIQPSDDNESPQQHQAEEKVVEKPVPTTRLEVDTTPESLLVEMPDNNVITVNDEAEIVVAETVVAETVVEETAAVAIEQTDKLQQLTVTLGNDSWIEVIDANKDVLLADLKRAGSRLDLEGKAPFEVLLGNGVDAQVSYMGESVVIPVNPKNNTARWKVGQ